MSNDQLFYNRMIEVLKLLAADYQIQISSFPNYVQIPDEIALSFEDVYIFSNNLKDSGMINEEQKAKLDYLNIQLDEMSENKSLWGLESLKEAQEWQEIRKLAVELIMLLGKTLERPDLSWLTFIEQ
jgi:hypothetical protein